MVNSQRTLSQILSTYITIILMVILLVGIAGVLAIPYYISPITYSQGGPSNGGYLVLGLILLGMMLAGVYFLERKQVEIGAFTIIFAVMILSILIWELYGVSNVNNIIHNI
ncbi:hypothetical protein GWK48_03545 [Metallosphaera tengchongensis]|uniref:DUF973 family protein n=1 Tax=Metallosphaera tengchongensis TaxID=1532350 RepID=A0A6N0NUQ1_9CREN|nr:hypothetical protein [Metallosphaera tengchongensis]QKQ99592.1 hypothetical protein GWK48_03545 [Metallosphaera tengchongensis]